MEDATFYAVDVFAEEKYAGNQLAVFREAGHIPRTTLQEIAAEMDYSKTTLVLSDEKWDGSCEVCIFTPGYEVPCAAIRRSGLRTRSNESSSAVPWIV